jgi:EEF1A lysine methyltransferase 4
MRTKAPPAFGSQDYWNQRFSANKKPFEWLGHPEVLDEIFVNALHESHTQDPQILHVGCGTSNLAYHLCSLVQSPEQIHNVDYSEVAIKLGRDLENQAAPPAAVQVGLKSTDERPRMRWNAVDLIRPTSLLQACKPESYSVFLDKSTSDSIACSDDVDIAVPYPIGLQPDIPAGEEIKAFVQTHEPLLVMSVNLAFLAKPGARWIVVSYSNDRFPFLGPSSALNESYKPLMDPRLLWRITMKQSFEPKDSVSTDTPASAYAHTPQVCHWIYVLERTDVPLYLLKGHC